jgi:LemA protein
MPISGWIVLGAVVLVVFVAISTYNRLVTLRNRFKNAYSQIDVQLKRRHDLIPNVVETAKGYLKHERETLDAVISARGGAVGALERAANKPGDPEAMKALSGAENLLGSALSRLLVTFEAYPDLKANQSMQQVMEELTSTENRIAFARQAFNDGVMEYNNARERFPSTLIAGPFGFAAASPFEIESPAERQAPKVAFA